MLTVGRFSYNRGYGKGYDILLKAISLCPEDYYLYIVGDEPTQEFIELRKKMGLINKVKFIGFKDKEELKEYYMAADLFCLQTRGDVWGLVINEAMSMALPVITTNQCVAGLELVKRNRNGFIVDPEDYQELSKDIKIILRNNEEKASMALESLKIISNYSITEIVLSHIKAFTSV
ncbi:glycosyltransferase family 4 protein [Limosilactobacillus fermentum]|uniref:glycosyltransferase family 4 protein n=1 Tax=Limosilactobacillus fermentum TaxID=1613 RepID=UPI003B66D747